MLAEFAFTPSVFDEGANEDAEAWRDQLRELGAYMFPRTAACPVMISNLYDGSWHNVVLAIAKSITDNRARVLCEGILENVGKSLVNRPISLGDWPDDNLGWGREAIASQVLEPIDRIVACRQIQIALEAEGQVVRCINEVLDGGFWSNISSQWSQPLRIAEQIQAIRKLYIFSDFLWLVTPHIRGTADDESDFAAAMIQEAIRRPAGFGRPDIEIHTQGPENPFSADFGQRLDNVVGNTTAYLRTVLSRGQSVRLVLWPHFVDRYLIAGVYTETSGGTRMRSPRWGIAMQHIARRADSYDEKPPTQWNLLTRVQLGDIFSRYCRDGSSAALHSCEIAG